LKWLDHPVSDTQNIFIRNGAITLNSSRMAFSRKFNLETAVGRTKGCDFLTFQQGMRTQHAHCLQGRNNDAGASKNCAILFVATFMVNFVTFKFFNIFIALTEFVSGQLLFLGSNIRRPDQ
jgi:hypothetical protein